MKIFLKACPRCRGDLVLQALNSSTLGLSCLQCGRGREASMPAALMRRVVPASRADLPSGPPLKAA
jgi:hypothetical protein